ncbi:MAG: hypothetical protein ACRDFB_05055, partial [Rhabdochlamydiaceae bacterium]
VYTDLLFIVQLFVWLKIIGDYMLKIGFDFPFRLAQVSLSLMGNPSLPQVFKSRENNSSLYKVAVIASQIFIYFRPQYTTQLIATFIRVLPTLNQVWLGEKNALTKEEWIGMLGDAIFLLAYVSSTENRILITPEKATRVALYVLATACMLVPFIQTATNYVISTINKTITEKTDALTCQTLTSAEAKDKYTNKIETIYDDIQCTKNSQKKEHLKIEDYYSKLTILSLGLSKLKSVDTIMPRLSEIKYILNHIQAIINSLETGNKIIKQCIENLELTREVYKEYLKEPDGLEKNCALMISNSVKEQMNSSNHSELHKSILQKINEFNDKIITAPIKIKSKNDNILVECEATLSALLKFMNSFLVDPLSTIGSGSTSSRTLKVCEFHYMLPLPDITIGKESYTENDIHFDWIQQRKEIELIHAISAQTTQTTLLNLQRQQDENTYMISLLSFKATKLDF